MVLIHFVTVTTPQPDLLGKPFDATHKSTETLILHDHKIEGGKLVKTTNAEMMSLMSLMGAVGGINIQRSAEETADEPQAGEGDSADQNAQNDWITDEKNKIKKELEDEKKEGGGE